MPDFFLEGVDTIHSNQYTISRTGGPTPFATTSTASMGASAAAPAASSGGGGGGEVMAIFNKIKGLVDPATVKSTNAVFQFDVKGRVTKNRMII